jgi:hypothetical protein
LFEQGGQTGQEPGQGRAVAGGEPVEQAAFGGEQVGMGAVEDGAAGRGELDQDRPAVAARGLARDEAAAFQPPCCGSRVP